MGVIPAAGEARALLGRGPTKRRKTVSKKVMARSLGEVLGWRMIKF